MIIFRTRKKFHGTKDRKHLVYVNFKIRSNREVRTRIRNVYDKLGYHETRPNLTLPEYWQEVINSKFVLSPPGNGEDCMRTWEAIYLGAIPIVTNSSQMWPLFKQVPVLAINEGEEGKVNDDFLNSYEPTGKSRQLLLADYWFQRIHSF